MPAVMLADASTAASAPGATSNAAAMSGMAMPGMAMSAAPSEPVSSTVEFPYGFPSAGRYRIFIQMKHGSTIETGVFDVAVQ
jgi:hypothetical protein